MVKRCRCGQKPMQVEYTIGTVDYCPTCDRPVWLCYCPTWGDDSTREFAWYLVRWFRENYKPGTPYIRWIPPESEE